MTLLRWRDANRWDPFGDLASLQETVNDLFRESMSPSLRRREFTSGWNPAVDILENDKEIVLQAELPGMKKDDITVEVKDNTVKIRGERKFHSEDKKENYHRLERSFGVFERSFALPRTVRQDKVQAKYHDGVLEVTLPKTEEAKRKKIAVTVH